MRDRREGVELNLAVDNHRRCNELDVAIDSQKGLTLWCVFCATRSFREMAAFYFEIQNSLPLRLGSSIPSAVANFASACKYLR